MFPFSSWPAQTLLPAIQIDTDFSMTSECLDFGATGLETHFFGGDLEHLITMLVEQKWWKWVASLGVVP